MDQNLYRGGAHLPRPLWIRHYSLDTNCNYFFFHEEDGKEERGEEGDLDLITTVEPVADF